MNTKTNAPLPTTYWVVENRFLAGCYPCDVFADRVASSLIALLDARIRTFIDLREEREHDLLTGGRATYEATLKELTENRHEPVTCVRIPIVDRGVPSVWSMRLILDAIDSSIRDEQPAYVHCFGGVGRTGTVVGCWLMRHGIADDTTVLNKIRELRRHTSLAREPSPHTPEQIRMVMNWKKAT